MSHYVVGFMFSEDFKSLALIRKEKPAWQKGKFNGVGGKVENGEAPIDAMHREFEEETGCRAKGWRYYLRMSGNNDDGEGAFMVDFFTITGDLTRLKTMEQEQVVIVRTCDCPPSRKDMIENLPWVIGLALDHLIDGRPAFVDVKYV